MNIKVVGFYDHGNIGDQAFKLAFPILFPSYNFSFCDTLKNQDLADTDLIIIGGGDVVKKDIIKYLYNVDIPAIAASVTITQGSDLDNISLFKKIIVRDELSLNIAQQYHDNVIYLPDFSFVLTPDPIAGRKIIEDQFYQSGHTLTDKFVTVVLNSYISFNSNDALTRDSTAFNLLVDKLAKLCESMDYSWIFLPMSTQSPWDDRSVAAWTGNRIKNKYWRNIVIYDKLSVQKTLNIISSSSSVISSRLHSTIFSTIAGVPFIDILHHDKNYGYVKTLDCLDWTTWLWSYDEKKVNDLLTQFLSVTDDTTDYGLKLKEFTLNAKEQLFHAAPNLLVY